ncbi:MAG TPA: hypothetical protein VGD46_25000 [Rhizobacter sp.]
MTKKTKYTHVTADGVVETRTSARPYTHVVVGRRDLVRERARLDARWIEQQRENHRYTLKQAAAEVGELLDERIYGVSQGERARANAWLETHGRNTEQYAQDRYNAAMADIGDGIKGKEQVLQWSMSHTNAIKAMGSWLKFWVDVRVVPLSSAPAAKAA